MSRPLVSCIVPAYNGERYLRQALESVLAQTYRPLDVMVVDDGSTDGTAAVVRAMAGRVRYLWQANAGPAAARNRGVAETRGELVAFLDADDLWEPERLVRQQAPLDDDPDLAYTICLIENFFMPGQEPATQVERENPRNQPMPGFVASGMLVRRSGLQRVGPFDASLGHGEAADWFLRARRAGLREQLVPEVLVHRRIHGANRSVVMAEESRDEFLHLLKRSLDERRAPPRASSAP